MNVKRLVLFGVAILATAGVAAFAANMNFSTGQYFSPTGPALFQGADLNIMVNRVNAIGNGSFTGAYNGTLGAITPSTVAATTISASGVTTATGGLTGPTATSPRTLNTCGVPATLTTSGTDTVNAAATDTYVSEITVPVNISTTGASLFNGTTQNGNVTVYLADSAGNQIAHTASTATSGATQYQSIAWVGGPIAVVGPATYYMYFQNSATSNSWRTLAVGHCGTVLHTGDTYGTFPTITPPTTFTTVVGPIAGLY